MQFFTTILALFVSASAASSIVTRQGPPSCAVPCLQTTNTFGCSSTDNACLCRNQNFIGAQEACINAACTTPSELAKADAFATQLCLFVGVTLSSAAPASTSASSSGTPAATSSTAPAASTSASHNAAVVIASSGSLAMLAGVAAVAFVL